MMSAVESLQIEESRRRRDREFVLRNETRSPIGLLLTLTMLGIGITEWVSWQRYLPFAAAVALLNVGSAATAAIILRSFGRGGMPSTIARLDLAQIGMSSAGGLIWGLAPGLLGLDVSVAANAVVVIFQAALLTITTVSMGTDRRRYNAFCIPLVIGTSLSNLAIGGRFQITVAIGVVLFFLFLRTLHREINETFVENIRLTEELGLLAVTDSLTKIANRAMWDRTIEEFEQRPSASEPIAVLIADVDWFKQVNDTFGHAAGDRVLVSISQRLLSVVKSTDTVARIGGDEFAILVRDVRSDAELDSITERITSHLLHDFMYDGNSVPVSTSVGSARQLHGEAVLDVMRRADEDLYANKRNRPLWRPVLLSLDRPDESDAPPASDATATLPATTLHAPRR
jgi:diguanylate cyclase (GGDEF)-like protein